MLPDSRFTGGKTARLFGALLLVCVLVTPAPAQKTRKPLTQSEVTDLLVNDVPSARVAELVRQYGISFQLNADIERTLRDAGATDELIGALRDASAKVSSPPPASAPAATTPAGPPVLIVQSTPGGAQVYIDDEPIGTTSPEGRLKLSKLAPGSHRVRVALSGYRDYEETISLASGDTVVAAALQAAQPPSGTNPPAASSQPLTSTLTSAAAAATATETKPTAALGITLGPGQAGQGLVITALVPNSPAEEAGLHPGMRILTIAGQQLVAPQDFSRSLLGHQPGDVVDVVYVSAGATSTARIRLASTSIFNNAPHFWVLHDHGPPVLKGCVGWMYVMDGMVFFYGQKGLVVNGRAEEKHNLEFPTGGIKEVRRNSMYLSAYHGFHIRLEKGGSVNFLLLNPQQGNALDPTPLLGAIERAMTKF